MSVKLLTEHHLEFLSLRGGCTGSSESIHVKIPYYRKSRLMSILFWLDCANQESPKFFCFVNTGNKEIKSYSGISKYLMFLFQRNFIDGNLLYFWRGVGEWGFYHGLYCSP